MKKYQMRGAEVKDAGAIKNPTSHRTGLILNEYLPFALYLTQ
jgi:hypothetical protein